MIFHDMDQGSPEWFEIRNGKVTSTCFKDAISDKPKGLIYDLIGQIETGYIDNDDYLSAAMLWGREMEPLALAQHEIKIGKKILHCGFITSTYFDWLGLSPDGYYYEDDQIVGVEVKGANTKKHVEIIDTNQIPNALTSKWKDQCMTWFQLDAKVKAVDFISYDERFGCKKYHCIRLNRVDVEDEIIKHSQKLTKFKADWDLITNRVIF